MTRANFRPPLLSLALVWVFLIELSLAAPARAEELLPFFAGGEQSQLLKTRNQRDLEAEAEKNPWTGLTMGSEVFGVSGMGRGSRGGFGGDVFLGYNKEFDNNIVLGVRGSVGTLPGLSNYGARGYGFGMADMKLGYDMGRLMPYVTVGVGMANAMNGIGNPTGGLNNVNNLFSRSGQSVTLTRVGAGFDYAVTNNLHIGVEASVVQAHGNGFGAPPQPGAAPPLP
jgi:outer membrane immunogenic protein